MSEPLATAIDAVKAKEAELLQLLNDALEPVLNALADMDLGILYVYGYTPGFNDGEPCEHSVNWFIGVEELASDERLEKVLTMLSVQSEAFEELEGLEYKSEWQGHSEEDVAAYENAQKRLYGLIESEIGIKTGDYDRQVVASAIDTVLIPALDREFGTDYQVVYVFKNGTFERRHDDYDCGY